MMLLFVRFDDFLCALCSNMLAVCLICRLIGCGTRLTNFNHANSLNYLSIAQYIHVPLCTSALVQLNCSLRLQTAKNMFLSMTIDIPKVWFNSLSGKLSDWHHATHNFKWLKITHI